MTTLHPCARCGRVLMRQHVKPQNLINFGRPYYRCKHDDFFVYADDKGVSPENPSCNCGLPSRGNSAKNKPYSVYYNCASRRCCFNKSSPDNHETLKDLDLPEVHKAQVVRRAREVRKALESEKKGGKIQKDGHITDYYRLASELLKP